MSQKSVTEVVAALIWNQDKFMICQRSAHKARGLLWEFVGGKVEPGETKEQALIRECQEELAVTLNVGEVFMDVTHEYPDLTVHLTLFHAAIREGVPQKLEHNDIRWITVDEIDQFVFCPADEEILIRLMQSKGQKDWVKAFFSALENANIQRKEMHRMNVICFGDSNTYGYDPRGYFGGRYEADNRWVDILAAETGWTISNMGQNGREIPSAAPTFPADTDLLIVMLGTNDLLQGRSPEQAAERLERFLVGISLD